MRRIFIWTMVISMFLIFIFVPLSQQYMFVWAKYCLWICISIFSAGFIFGTIQSIRQLFFKRK